MRNGLLRNTTCAPSDLQLLAGFLPALRYIASVLYCACQGLRARGLIAAWVLISAAGASFADYYTIKPLNGDNTARQFENLYQAAAVVGKIPVKRVVVQKGDRIIDILKRENAFFGDYVPLFLSALVCDLNQGCPRERKLRADQPTNIDPVDGWPANLTVLRSTIELQDTEVDTRSWPQPGQVIVIPKFDVTKIRGSVRVEKNKKNSLKNIVSSNEVCQDKKLDAAACEDTILYLNQYDKRITSQDFSGSIEVPAYSYTVNTECVQKCAVSNRLLYFDTVTQSFVTPPFSIVDITSTAIDPEVFNERYLDSAHQQFSLPPEFKARLEDSAASVKDRIWRAVPGIDLDQDFDLSHRAELQKVDILTPTRYPMKLTGLVPRRIMVLDANFDKDHCEFAAGAVTVFDCSVYKGNEAECTPAPPQAVVSEGFTANDRERCGDTGVWALEGVVNPSPKQALERHGTQMVGLIAAKWDDFGIGGLSPETEVLGVKIDLQRLFTNHQYGNFLLENISALIQENQVSVVVLASESTSNVIARNWFYDLVEVTNYATFVVSGGNTKSRGPLCDIFPACFSSHFRNLIAVAALNSQGNGFYASTSIHDDYAIAALGENVPTTTPLNRYDNFTGTSPAAAIVAGIVNLSLRSKDAELKPSDVKDRLIVCSDISSWMEKKMKGGAIDAGCVIKAEVDLIYKTGASEPIIAKKHSTTIVNSSDEKLLFKDDDSEDREFSMSRIKSFQRVDGDDDQIVMFYSKKSNSSDSEIEKKFGTFPGEYDEQKLKVKLLDGSREEIEISEIRKYVRAGE